jgi:Leu/Phe-tRNA-protein transferase
VQLGAVFTGESMFYLADDASGAALVDLPSVRRGGA